MRVFSIEREFEGLGGEIVATPGLMKADFVRFDAADLELTPALREEKSPLQNVSVIDTGNGQILLDTAAPEESDPSYALVFYHLPGGFGPRSNVKTMKARELVRTEILTGWSLKDGKTVQAIALVEYSEGEATMNIKRVGGGFGPKDIHVKISENGEITVDYEDRNPDSDSGTEDEGERKFV